MKLSLRAKFFLYISPLGFVLPLLVYTLVAPYTQMRGLFSRFVEDAKQIVLVEKLFGVFENEQKSYFHLVLDKDNPEKHEQDLMASKEKLDHALEGLRVSMVDEELKLLNEIEDGRVQLRQMEQEAVSLANEGKENEATTLLMGPVDDFMDQSLGPKIEKLVNSEEVLVRRSLPLLLSTISRFGFLPIRPIQEKLSEVTANFDNLLLTSHLEHEFARHQVEYFHRILEPKSIEHVVALDDSEMNLESLLGHLRENSKETDLIDGLLRAHEKQDEIGKEAINSGQVRLLTEEMDDLLANELEPGVERLAEIEEENINRNINQLRANIDLLIRAIYLVSGAVFLIGVGAVLLLLNEIISPIIKLRQAAERIARGDLKTRVTITSKDEIGRLGLAFNEMAQKLQESYSDLEGKVRERTAQLEVANEKLKELDKLKDEFVSVASHELRTPMGAIKSFIAMILGGDYGEVNENLKEPLQDMKASVERLIRLVNDLLDVARIEAGRMKFNIVEADIKDVVREIVTSLAPVAQGMGVGLRIEGNESVVLRVDPDKVKQVLNNLVGNALKFTTEGEVVVSVVKKDNIVEVSVADTGMGIADEDKGKLFGKFQQVGANASTRPQGTGLGLYISREIIRNLGGDLSLKSSIAGKGSVFTFTLPISVDTLKTNE